MDAQHRDVVSQSRVQTLLLQNALMLFTYQTLTAAFRAGEAPLSLYAIPCCYLAIDAVAAGVSLHCSVLAVRTRPGGQQTLPTNCLKGPAYGAVLALAWAFVLVLQGAGSIAGVVSGVALAFSAVMLAVLGVALTVPAE
ncbi:Transmembrane domain-containing protein [Spironucleus salmonicida]|uniref:Transmembrane domain-containing protein n=1 Tax=Spironucleus salmonicida TaxID=348837 RepID=A0A9P8LLE3_9EUKA|nr:Transmembrane domain-containing protein [Spironucleus salmonicida]